MIEGLLIFWGCAENFRGCWAPSSTGVATGLITFLIVLTCSCRSSFLDFQTKLQTFFATLIPSPIGIIFYIEYWGIKWKRIGGSGLRSANFQFVKILISLTILKNGRKSLSYDCSTFYPMQNIRKFKRILLRKNARSL